MNRDNANALKNEILSAVFNRFGPSAVAEGAGGAVESEPLIAVGIGASESKKEPGFRPAVRVQKRLLRDLPELVERKRKGQIDLRFIGRVVAQMWNRGRVRPLEPGVSIGHYTGPTGTLGCFVTLPNGLVGALSNQHVLSQLLGAGPGPAEHTIQSGRADGGRDPQDRVGAVALAVPIPNPPDHLVGARNTLDCAVSRIDPALATAGPNVIRGLGPITGTVADLSTYLDVRSEPVYKLGRTTGLTTGVVTAIDLDEIVVEYQDGGVRKTFAFTGIFEIEEFNGRLFSDGGDSGSVIVDRHGSVLGLLFAGSKRGGRNNRPRTFAVPIAPVLAALNVTIPPSTPAPATRTRS
ncbi:MAG: hypothetical protein K2V38_12225 [Gemmataceae bacterium]|nr:hypothetical protein [Gemmataceae bacterium]